MLSIRLEVYWYSLLNDVEQLGSWSGIALGCSVVKVFMRVLARRLGRFAEDRTLTQAQGGFRSGRRCSDQRLVLRDVCEVRRGRRIIHIWTSWILVRLMTVWERGTVV